MKDRQDYMRKNGLLNDKLAKGLENIYVDVIKFILSEKIIEGFNKNKDKAKFGRFNYLSKNIKKTETFIKKHIEKYFFGFLLK